MPIEQSSTPSTRYVLAATDDVPIHQVMCETLTAMADLGFYGTVCHRPVDHTDGEWGLELNRGIEPAIQAREGDTIVRLGAQAGGVIWKETQ